MEEKYTSVKVKKLMLNKFTILAAEQDIPRKDLLEKVLEDYLKSQNKL